MPSMARLPVTSVIPVFCTGLTLRPAYFHAGFLLPCYNVINIDI